MLDGLSEERVIRAHVEANVVGIGARKVFVRELRFGRIALGDRTLLGLARGLLLTVVVFAVEALLERFDLRP